MDARESRRRRVLYSRARARYARAHPERGFNVDHAAVYLAPAPMIAALLTPHGRGESED